jgi:hypothetical protein
MREPHTARMFELIKHRPQRVATIPAHCSKFSVMQLFLAVLLGVVLSMVAAECPNACSSHGKCGAFDMCQCYRNWMSNDCSESKSQLR